MDIISRLKKQRELAPSLHKKLPFTVYLEDKRGNRTDTRHVLASSPHRAVLTGLIADREIFNRKKSTGGRAVPDGWKYADEKNKIPEKAVL